MQNAACKDWGRGTETLKKHRSPIVWQGGCIRAAPVRAGGGAFLFRAKPGAGRVGMNMGVGHMVPMARPGRAAGRRTPHSLLFPPNSPRSMRWACEVQDERICAGEWQKYRLTRSASAPGFRPRFTYNRPRSQSDEREALPGPLYRSASYASGD